MGGEVVSSHDVVLVSIIIVVMCRCHNRQSMAMMIVAEAHFSFLSDGLEP